MSSSSLGEDFDNDASVARTDKPINAIVTRFAIPVFIRITTSAGAPTTRELAMP